ncbi:hypothetical protein BGZ98_005675, partial [Dissophora globulifera]
NPPKVAKAAEAAKPTKSTNPTKQTKQTKSGTTIVVVNTGNRTPSSNGTKNKPPVQQGNNRPVPPVNNPVTKNPGPQNNQTELTTKAEPLKDTVPPVATPPSVASGLLTTYYQLLSIHDNTLILKSHDGMITQILIQDMTLKAAMQQQLLQRSKQDQIVTVAIQRVHGQNAPVSFM